MHVYRWDLDRTYLDTSIDSVRGLLRTALEAATDKRTLPGAGALLRGLQQSDPEAMVCILSGSPTQLRAVLEEKLALDGVRFDKLLLKDNLGNLKRGRLRALRGQVGYKLPVLLQERAEQGPGAREVLFGDDSEADALIYVAYAEALAGHLTAADLASVLKAGGAYDDHIELATRALARITPDDVVDDIFIRLDRRSPVARFRLLGDRVTPVHSWLQAALRLHAKGRLGAEGVAEVVAAELQAGHDLACVGGWVQDAVRRGLVDRDQVEALWAAPALEAGWGPIQQALAWMPRPLDASVPTELRPDYLRFLKELARAHG